MLDIAQRLFLEQGYDGTSMAQLAEQAEVSPNTLYWYFEDKDALLVEVLNATLVRMSGRYLEQRHKSFDALLLWLAQVIKETSSLVATVHTRAPLSPAVAQWHERFHAFLELQFSEHLQRDGLEPAKAKHASRIAMFVLEGMVSHACTSAERRELVRALMAGLDA